MKLFGIQLTMEKLSLNYNIIMKIMYAYLLKEERIKRKEEKFLK